MEDLDYITLSPDETAKLLAAGSGEAALLYLYWKSAGDPKLLLAQQKLRMPESTLQWAKQLLLRLGLLDSPVSQQRYDAERAPVYTAQQVQRYASEHSDFALLQGEVSRRLGRTLSSEDLKLLLSLQDYLKLPPEVIMMALTCCIQKNEYYNRARGTTRTVTLRTLERECYDWANQGIRTLDQASAQIGRSLAQAEPESQVRKAMGLDHAPISSEKEYIASWLKMGFSVDAIRIAYEKTIMGTGKLAWPYMNRILLNWHEKNLHTAEEVAGGDTRKAATAAEGGNPTGAAAQQSGQSPFRPGQQERAAIGNLQSYLSSIRD